jgi:CubicO group peptidase (beta-lactamase class C family)
MDFLALLTHAPLPFLARCAVPEDLDSVTTFGREEPLEGTGVDEDAVESVWSAAEAFYRTGITPALQLCIRRRGRIVLNRAMGHARGNAPDDGPEVEKVLATCETPFNIYSASKLVTAMLIHKLDERGVLHLEDRVSDFIPEFAGHGKQWITLRHLLSHRAGIPNIPPEAMDLDLLGEPDAICRILCEMRPNTRPGRLLSYHAISSGFVLGEVVRRATGMDIRRSLEKEIVGPLGFRWMRYGVAPEDVGNVALDALTGPPPPPPIRQLLVRALGKDLPDLLDVTSDRRFLTGIVPSGNVFTNAEELSAFLQCMLQEGELGGVRVFEPRTVHHALNEES